MRKVFLSIFLVCSYVMVFGGTLSAESYFPVSDNNAGVTFLRECELSRMVDGKKVTHDAGTFLRNLSRYKVVWYGQLVSGRSTSAWNTVRTQVPEKLMLRYSGSLSARPDSTDGFDYDYINTYHPEWFLLKDTKDPRYADPRNANNRIRWVSYDQNSSNYNRFYIDVCNSDFQDWAVEQLLNYVSGQTEGLAHPYSGLAFDNVVFRRIKVRFNKPYPNWKYVNDIEGWKSGFLTYLRKIKSALHAKGYLFAVNFSFYWDLERNGSDLDDLMTTVDGVMHEWPIGSIDRYYWSNETWLRALERHERVVQNGLMDWWSCYQSSDTDLGERQFRYVYCSYLLIAERGYSLFYAASDHGLAMSRPVPWHEQYDLAIGEPTSSRYQRNNCWLRDYAGGRVIVNPTEVVQEITFAQDDRLSDWQTHQSVTTLSLQPKTAKILLKSGNDAPVLNDIDDKLGQENAEMTFSLGASDENSDALSYSAKNLPDGAVLTGDIFSWTPGYEDAGSYEVTFTVSDGELEDSRTVAVTISNVNRPPVPAATGNRSVNENSFLNFTVEASDPDGDELTYSVENLPVGATFNDNEFLWNVGFDAQGDYPVIFTVSDGQEQTCETVTIMVGNINRAPFFEPITDQFVETRSVLSFGVVAADPDNDPVNYSVANLPDGADFTSGVFTWQPDVSQAGRYQIVFTASDGELTDSRTVTVETYNNDYLDTRAPSVVKCKPKHGSIQNPLNTLIILNIVDYCAGIDPNSVVILVDEEPVYQGNSPAYSSQSGLCSRGGTKSDYRFTYQPNQMFDHDQTVTVCVSARDLSGNIMDTLEYNFTTEMYSFSSPVSVNASVGGRPAGEAVTAVDSAGSIWMAWHEGNAGGRNIYVGRRSADTGDSVSSVQITTNAADQCRAAIAIAGNDKLYLTWQDRRNGNWDIYVSSSVDGTTWDEPVRVTQSELHQIDPVIAVDSSNKVYIAWQDFRDRSTMFPSNRSDIYLADSTDGFTNFVEKPITAGASAKSEPAIAIDAMNNVYIVWTNNDDGVIDIYGASSRSAWANVAIVAKSGSQKSPAISAQAESATLHMAWVDDALGDDDIFYAVMEDGLAESALVGRSIIDDDSHAGQASPCIITSGSGESTSVFLCWRDERNYSADRNDGDIYFSEISSGSGTNCLITDEVSNADQSAPAIGTNDKSDPYIVWTNHTQENEEICYASMASMKGRTIATVDISASLGGRIGPDPDAIASEDDVCMSIPPGAFWTDLTISIMCVDAPSSPQSESDVLSSYEFGPSSEVEFSKPVVITIPYTVASTERDSTVFWYNPQIGSFSQAGISDIENIYISPNLRAIRFRTTHFSRYIVAGESGTDPDGGPGDAGFGGGCSMCRGETDPVDIIEFFLPYMALLFLLRIIARLRRRAKANF